MEQMLVFLNIILAATLIFLIEKVINLHAQMARIYSEMALYKHKTLIETFRDERKL